MTLQKKIIFYFFSFVLLFIFSGLNAEEAGLFDDLFSKGIHADLREPSYSDGVIRTSQGGVIHGPDLRIQAREMIYTRKVIDGDIRFTVEAEGDLQMEFNDYVFVGRRLEYDFQTKTGVIYDGRSSAEPWFFGGERILLRSDGSYWIENGFVTTSENIESEWKISAPEAVLFCNKDFKASNVKFNYVNIPLFWLPSLKVNLDYIFDAPIRYSARWGGRQGPRAEFIYEVFSWNRLKVFLRCDYRLTRGPGVGIETYYRSEDHLESFEAINYIARDSSLDDRKEQMRFRFQGAYRNVFMDKKLCVNLVYDKLSDKDMATDYSDSGLDLEYSGLTRLQVRRQETNWIANFLTTVRLNNFQSVKQDLPTLETSYRPFKLGRSGIISDTRWRASYLDFKFATRLKCARNYRSGRFEYLQRYYRPWHFGPLNITPEVGAIVISYSDVFKSTKRWLVSGLFSVDANASFHRFYSKFKHVLTPYLKYHYYTFPTSNPNEHYIFDISDGWYRLNMLTLGCRQNIYVKTPSGIVDKAFTLDLYAHAFFNTQTLPQIFQRLYADLSFNSTERLRHTLNSAWDIAHHRLGHFNLLTEWTASENLAIATEFRYRDPYDWRKADHTNFILDSFRSEKELLQTSLSDQRETFLVHLFYRLNPNWALQIHSRTGWGRKKQHIGSEFGHCSSSGSRKQNSCSEFEHSCRGCKCRRQPPYTEFEIDFLGTLHSAWQVKVSYQHRENDHHRFTIGFNIGLTRPDRWKCEHLIPALNF